MAKAVVIESGAIAAIRTSIERVLGWRPRARHTAWRDAATFPAYWREAAALGGEDLALRVALELPVATLGPGGDPFATARTLGEALHVFRRDAQHAVAALRTELANVGRAVELSIRGPDLLHPILEILIGVVALRCRRLPGPPLAIVELGIPRAAPRDPTAWERAFGVRPRFGVDHAYLRLPVTALVWPLRAADVAAASSTDPGSTRDRVRAYVREWLHESPGVDQVARALGMSRQSLQRKLAADQASFREVVTGVRVDVAHDLLRRGDLTVAQVATAVGFTGTASFTRAFTRARGISPAKVRDRRPRPPARVS